jgi:glycosyltransferase involved in cell wall biosynthesis
MKIAIVLPNLGDSGTRRVALTLAKGFVARGCMVDLVIGHTEGVYKDIPKGVNLVNLRVSIITPRLGIRQIISFFPLISYFRKKRPQVVLPIFDFFESVVAMAIECALSPQKRPLLVYSIHNDVRFLEDFVPYKRFVIRQLKKDILRRADRIVAVSHGIAESWHSAFRLPIDRIDVIYNPLDIDRIRALALEGVSHPYLQPNGYPVILGMGRLNTQKDFPTLIRAFAQVKKQREARLIILGEGQERPRLEALIKELKLTESVDLPGFASNPFAYVARSALFVLSSRYEGLSTVLLEALALGVPVISTDCPHSPREILQNGRLGPLVPVGNSVVLANAILKVLEAPPQAEILRQRAEDFSIDRAVDAYLALFASTAR